MSFHKQFQLDFDFCSTLAHPAGHVKKQLAASLIDSNLHASYCHRYLTDFTQLPTTRDKLLHARLLACTVAEIRFSACERERLLGSRLLEGVQSSLIPCCQGGEHDS